MKRRRVRGLGFPGFFCYAAQMKNERLSALIEQINAGQLSRNKNFVAFREPLVRQARDRQQRIHTLKQILNEAEKIDIRPDREGYWKLDCRFSKWDFNWSAWLRDFEVKLLRKDPEIEKMLDQ